MIQRPKSIVECPHPRQPNITIGYFFQISDDYKNHSQNIFFILISEIDFCLQELISPQQKDSFNFNHDINSTRTV